MNLKSLSARIGRLEMGTRPPPPNGGIVFVVVKEGESNEAAKARTLAAQGIDERHPGLCPVYVTEDDLQLR